MEMNRKSPIVDYNKQDEVENKITSVEVDKSDDSKGFVLEIAVALSSNALLLVTCIKRIFRTAFWPSDCEKWFWNENCYVVRRRFQCGNKDIQKTCCLGASNEVTYVSGAGNTIYCLMSLWKGGMENSALRWSNFRAIYNGFQKEYMKVRAMI